MTILAKDAARSHVPLVAAWFVVAGLVGPIGFLLHSLSEGTADRLVGLVMVGTAVLACVAGVLVVNARSVARRWSVTLSALLVVVGIAAAGMALTGTAAFVSDALLLGLPPVVGGLITGALALRR